MLTVKGRALVPLIEDMRAYGTQWLGADCADGTCDDASAALPGVAEPAAAESGEREALPAVGEPVAA